LLRLDFNRLPAALDRGGRRRSDRSLHGICGTGKAMSNSIATDKQSDVGPVACARGRVTRTPTPLSGVSVIECLNGIEQGARAVFEKTGGQCFSQLFSVVSIA